MMHQEKENHYWRFEEGRKREMKNDITIKTFDEWEAPATENDVRVGGRLKTIMVAKVCSKNYLEQRKAHKDFSLIDAIILSAARANNSKILTGDKHFRGLKETIFLD